MVCGDNYDYWHGIYLCVQDPLPASFVGACGKTDACAKLLRHSAPAILHFIHSVFVLSAGGGNQSGPLQRKRDGGKRLDKIVLPSTGWRGGNDRVTYLDS